jgi:glutaredoxin-like protein
MATILDDSTKKQIINIFSNLKNPVGVLFFGSSEENYGTCEQTRQLLTELTDLSDLLHLECYDIGEDALMAREYNVEDTPAILLGDYEHERTQYRGIHFYGIPAGHEFTSLIRDILMVSARDSGLRDETRSFLADLEKPVHLQVFVTPTCPYCPQAVVMAHQMAYESDLVEAEMIEALEFPELSDQYGVSGVPHTIINDGAAEVVGSIPEGILVHKIQQMIADEAW